MKHMGKKIMTICLCVVIVVASLAGLTALFVPKYMTGIVEGAMIAEYYDEVKNHDVVFIGDCELYENLSPAVLWEEYGIHSYIRGSAQQLIWQSYYLMEDTLRYEKPKAFVFNVLSMKYDAPQSEAYNRMSIDGMKWSKSKIDNIKASMTQEEHFLEYVFPLLRYHARWSDLNRDDITYFAKKDKVTFNGYYMRADVLAAENVPEGKPLADYQFGDNSYAYLDKMTELCKEQGIELILVKAPSLYPYWYDEWEQQIEEYAQKHQLKYYNFLEDINEIGLDFTTDTYDSGLHLNLSGATKLSRYFGDILMTEFGLTSRKNEEELSRIWDQKLKAYYEEIRRQEDAIAKGEKIN